MIKSGLLSTLKQNPKVMSLGLSWFGLRKIPLICFIGARIKSLNQKECSLVVPLNYRTKNHLGSMYFGVLSTAADLAGGLLAMKLIENSPAKIDLVFKSFHAHFYKRVEGDCVFLNDEGPAIEEFVAMVAKSSERHERMVKVKAYVPSKLGETIAAEFDLELSLKRRD